MSSCISCSFSSSLLLVNPPPRASRNDIRRSLRMSLNNDNNNSNFTSSSLLNSVTKLLWGQSLPPGILVASVRTAWNSAWGLMMSQLAPSDSTGGYSRPASKFRILGSLSPGTLHLYVGLACPWAHRTLIVRALKGLEEAVPVSVASPGMDGSWEFKGVGGAHLGSIGPSLDKANGCRTLKEVYGLGRGGYDGRSTVPMLWNKGLKNVVCNESYDIIQLFNSGLNGMAGKPELDLSPPELKEEIEEWYRIIYPNVNNGVYRCGFAQSQEAYDRSVNELFCTLDRLEDHLANSRYLCGDQFTLVDVCLFTTLIRFDLAYNVLFKCTKKKLSEYANLHAYMRDIYQIPKVAATCNFTEIMDGYYKTLFPLNPGSIRPVMPSTSDHQFLYKPHGRESLSSATPAIFLY